MFAKALAALGVVGIGLGLHAAAPFTIVSYNLRHGACNESSKVDLARQMGHVTNELMRIRWGMPRFVALQEVDVNVPRSGKVDQPTACAKLLGEGYVATFGKAIDLCGGGYGVALISKGAPLSVERLPIPDSSENRVLLICEFEDCFIASTHFSVATERDRETALKVVRARLRKGFGKPFFICGDLNSSPDSKIIEGLKADFEVLSSMREATYIGGWKKTDSATNTVRCIDYILCDKVNVKRIGALKYVLGKADRVAPSDHRPIAVRLSPRGSNDREYYAFDGGDWRSDRIQRGLVPEPTAADFAKAKAEWEAFPDRHAAWGPAPDFGEPNAPVAVAKTQLWVAPDGDDRGGDGTKAKPFATLGRARDAVRTLKKGGLPEGGVTVFFRGGTYAVTNTTYFGEQDGGETNAPVLYCAAPGETPVFDGGFRVTGWKPYKGAIKVADVKALGCTTFKPAGATGFEASREGTGPVRTDFYLDGVRQLPAEYPNEGWLLITSNTLNNIACVRPDDLRPWANERNLYAKMYPACYWADLTSPVTNVDVEAGKMYTIGRGWGRQHIRRGLPYRLQNALGALDREGECMLDFKEGKVYAWNPEGKDAVLSDCSKDFLMFQKTQDLEFRGLVFRYGRAGAVTAMGAKRISFRDCQFVGFGQNGIMSKWGRWLTVDGCRFRHFGYHAMYVSAGNRKTLKGGRTFIQNCDISHPGMCKADFAFGAIVDGCGAMIRWNRFHEGAAAMIRLNGNDLMLASNVFERCDYEAGDMGVIDIYANPTHASRIIHNLFRDCGSGEHGFVDAGQAAIRFDDAVCNQIVYGNRFENCSPHGDQEWGFGCLNMNGGRNNTIENNLFVGGWRLASITAWPQKKWASYLANKSVVAMISEVDWKGPDFAKRYPGIDRLEKMELVNRFYRNVQIGTGRFVSMLDGRTDARCNFAYRDLPDEATLNANPLWDPLPPESALGPRRPVVGR